jgi:hypothetical protein
MLALKGLHNLPKVFEQARRHGIVTQITGSFTLKGYIAYLCQTLYCAALFFRMPNGVKSGVYPAPASENKIRTFGI